MSRFPRISNLIKRQEIIFGILALVALIILGISSGSTYDTGDSVTHYLYSRYSWQVHYFFVHGWAKPVFVALSSPFAQFGFTGMKVFQALVLSLSVFFIIKIAKDVGLSHPWLAGIIFLSMPQVVLMTASGLTEPLFGLFTVSGIYFLFRKQFITSMIIFSFLYYVRSEGIIVVIPVIFYLLITKNAKFIPLLGISIIFYGLVGLAFNAPFFWYIINNPYNHPPGFYGYGTLSHYFDVLKGLAGDVIYLLIYVGGAWMLYMAYRNFRFRNVSYFNERLILIYGIAVGYFAFESFVWWKGLFGSYGMPRVLVGVMPLFALIAWDGWHGITAFFSFYSRPFARVVQIMLATYVIAFPFLNTPRSYHFPGDFRPNEEAQVMTQAVNWTKQQVGLSNTIYYANPYIAVRLPEQTAFDKDLGDFKIFRDPRQLPSGSIYIWDGWFSVVERKAKLEDLTTNGSYTLLKCFESNSWKACVLKKN